jgi:hypothetical protein
MKQPQGGHTVVPTAPPDALDEFLDLSIYLTGFEGHVLRGTGMLQAYYDELLRIIGAREAGSFLSAFRRAHKRGKAAFENDVLCDDRFGPIARSVLTMWYLGMWTQLPREWRDTYGATFYDIDHVVSAAAYRESMVWRAAGTHPMSAKAPGFGTWEKPSALPGAAGTGAR